jgi:adenylyltransferase/sulfurtransferase
VELRDSQFHRYARHLILDEVGEEGQAKLLAARVLVVGAGGLGSPLLLYLAAAGIGTLGVIDDDDVDLTNLQRQVVHMTASVGRPKVDSAAETIAAINPDVRVEAHRARLTAANAMDLVAGYDVVADGSDNFATRYLLNDACFFAKKPLVSAALLRFEGQISTYAAWRDPKAPCYRCLFAAPPPPDLIPRCEQAGILGAVAGVIGTLQATEVLKEVLGLGDSLSGTLLAYDALAASFTRVAIVRDPECALCGTRPTIRDLSGHG